RLAAPRDARGAALLRSLADLEEAHTSGALDEAGYLRLREQTVGRMERVLRALDRRDAAHARHATRRRQRPGGRVRPVLRRPPSRDAPPPRNATRIALEGAPAGGGRGSAAEPR